MAARNIILCSDGTGNTANKGRGTNVFKLFEAVDATKTFSGEHPEQIVVYDDGVGTNRFAPLRYLGGAFGFGLARNVRQLYRALCRTYRDGDRIYLFGFSRGAYTARTLAGVITECGIIDLDDPKPVRGFGWLKPGSDRWLQLVSWRGWRTHRRAYSAWIERLLFFWQTDGATASADFRKRYARHGNAEDRRARVHFVGVWDTVAAIGLPFDWITTIVNTVIFRFSFPDTKLSEFVEKGCHALAIDDERLSFRPILWDETTDRTVGPCRCTEEQTTYPERDVGEAAIEQVWFAGVHSNVGGGYPKQGMSLVALDWMMRKAEQHGLHFCTGARRAVTEQQNVNDKLYNSRAGLSTYYRYLPRDMETLCAEKSAVPRLHVSVLDRIATGTTEYRPSAPAPKTRVVETLGDGRADLAELQDGLKRTRVRAAAPVAVWLRRLAHFALAGVTYVALDLAATASGGWWQLIKDLASSASSLSVGTLGRTLFVPLWQAPILRWVVPAAVFLIWLVSTLAKGRIDSRRAEYWRSVFPRKPV